MGSVWARKALKLRPTSTRTRNRSISGHGLQIHFFSRARAGAQTLKATGRVVLLDFGIAKLVQADGTGASLSATDVTSVVGQLREAMTRPESFS